jgi:hypothetical protein
MRVMATLILMLLLAAPVLAEDDATNGIDWVKSFDEGMALAEKNDRHLLVNFYTPT